MDSFNRKQKIIGGILLGIAIAIIGYYIYNKDNGIEIVGQEENITTQRAEKNSQEENINTNEKEKETIFVHISGAVNKEGVIELSKNSRISDAIDKAGGLKEDANLKNINLAYKLEDGMKVYIPTNQELNEKENGETNESEKENEILSKAEDYNKYITNAEGEKNNSVESEKVNINTATQTELETLPGIGPSTALKIINYRKENGKFKNIEDLKEVSGIGETKFKNIRDLIKI